VACAPGYNGIEERRLLNPFVKNNFLMFEEWGLYLHGSFDYFEMTEEKEMKYKVDDVAYKVLKINTTVRILLGKTVHVPSTPSFTVKWKPVVYKNRRVRLAVRYNCETVVSRANVDVTTRMDKWLDGKLGRVFQNSGLGAPSNYKFATVEYGKTTPASEMKFLTKTHTFQHAFGDAKDVVLYAYWRHKDKPAPKRWKEGERSKYLSGPCT